MQVMNHNAAQVYINQRKAVDVAALLLHMFAIFPDDGEDYVPIYPGSFIRVKNLRSDLSATAPVFLTQDGFDLEIELTGAQLIALILAVHW